MQTRSPQTEIPLGARVMAVVDGLIATAGAVCVLDYPWLSLIILAAVYPERWGLFRGREWGWKWGVGVHVAVPALGLLAYEAMASMFIADMDRPPGHMEWITSKGALIVLSVVLVVYLFVSAVPLVYLLRKSVRAAFVRDSNTHPREA